MYAKVVVDTGATSAIESLTYEIPDGLVGKVSIGSCVLVPLGPRQAVGYIIGLEETTSLEKTRHIIAELDSPVKLGDDLFDLSRWISKQYICPLPKAVAGMLPGVMHCKLQTRVVLDNPKPDSYLTPAENNLFTRIKANESDVTLDSLYEGNDKTSIQRIIRQLETKGYIKRIWQLLPPSGKPRIIRGVKIPESLTVNDEYLSTLSDKQAEIVKIVAEIGRSASLLELSQRFGISRQRVSALEKKGILEGTDVTLRRAPAFIKMRDNKVQLNEEQQTAVDEVTASLNAGEYRAHLLYGVTASGKTEVYLRCIERALALGKTSLVLLPEIALTTQVMNIFKSRFGDQVAVLHSALSAGERCDEWIRIQDGEARVILGARSAIFAPLDNIGLVVVDEEHEGSYKQDTQPRYHGREAAIERAKSANAALILGSATPSIESYYLAQRGDYKLLTMSNRVEGRSMPQVHVADLREEYVKGKPTIFSSKLQEAIQERLDKKQQVILFQNRRAYSTFLLCRECGFVMQCPNCAVSLKFHSAERKLTCHHCDYTIPAPDACPKCTGLKIGKFGIGTERIEEETKLTFPSARVLRMDRDTTSKKGSHATILDTFRNGEADILVGTQMIAKGLDFPNVTLVGVISADTSLHLPDFRASERTFQLISQVSGRSGRGVEPGEVVIQTFDPENYAIQCAVNHDYLGFYEQELENRQELSYPPFSYLVNITSSDPSLSAAESRLTTLANDFKSSEISKQSKIEVMGPMPSVLSKLRGEYRWHLVLRSPNREAMLQLLRKTLDKNASLRKYLIVDVDPMSML